MPKRTEVPYKTDEFLPARRYASAQCWNWPKRTGGQLPKFLKFCPGIEI